MPFGNVPLAFEDNGTTALKAEVTKLHEQAQTGEMVSLYWAWCGADNTTKGTGSGMADVFRVYCLDVRVKRGVINGYMAEREKIQRGTRLKLLTQRDGVASGTLARVDTVREENCGTAWAFSVYWDDYRKKNRHSLFFIQADLESFEMVEEGYPGTSEGAISRPLQLALPFTQWQLYRGTDVLGDGETW